MQIHVDAAAHFSALKRSLRLLRTPRFGTYYVATLLSNIGTWSQQIAEPWLLLSLGASSFLGAHFGRRMDDRLAYEPAA